MKSSIKYFLMAATAVISLSISLPILRETVFSAGGTAAEIYCNSRLVHRIDLQNTPARDFSLLEVPNIVFHVTGDGAITFTRADYPDRKSVRLDIDSRQEEPVKGLPADVRIRIVSNGILSWTSSETNPRGGIDVVQRIKTN